MDGFQGTVNYYFLIIGCELRFVRSFFIRCDKALERHVAAATLFYNWQLIGDTILECILSAELTVVDDYLNRFGFPMPLSRSTLVPRSIFM